MKQIYHVCFIALWICAALYLITVAMDLMNTKSTTANFIGFFIIIFILSVSLYITIKSLR
jgi:hypothetical protein